LFELYILYSDFFFWQSDSTKIVSSVLHEMTKITGSNQSHKSHGKYKSETVNISEIESGAMEE
jgi:hypothetical protein